MRTAAIFSGQSDHQEDNKDNHLHQMGVRTRFQINARQARGTSKSDDLGAHSTDELLFGAVERKLLTQPAGYPAFSVA